ncbi:MAG: ATP-binding protein [Nanoarchaeota archaeon]|nr:ATP-binding protein [Nanoarchaeota archaeon]MBU1631797.1 ATP-binding protein [Nanoarchaeota archaeon]MBU1876589.1 ATP-binding protein [Nanoarchaeota archaeon]
MEVDEQIKIFREFIENNYYPQLLEAVRKGEIFLNLDFSQLIKFNTEITEELLENPEELLKAAEIAIKDFDLPKKVSKFNVRLINIPESQKILISEIRSKHLNKFVWMEGVVRQKSEVRPHVTAAKFECPSCGNILNVLQLDKKYKEPTRCGCGRKGKFKEISKELVDGQGLVLEESPEDIDGAQPKRINIFLKDDLVSPFSERKSSPGSRIRIAGWVTEVPITLRTGGQATKYDLIIEANSVEPLQDDTANMQIDEKDLEEIKNIAKSPNPLYLLANNLVPSIYGHDKIKEAIVLQLAGGCRKTRSDGVVTRGDMHMLLIGDPGSGKSQLLKRLTKIAPKARFTSGKGASLDYDEPLLIKDEKGVYIEKIGDIVEKNCVNKEDILLPFKRKIEALTFNPKTLKLKWKKIDFGYKHKTKELLYKIELESGRKVTVTGDHSLFSIINGKICQKTAAKHKVGETLIIPATLKHKGEIKNKSVACLLGYFIAEGHARSSKSSYKIEFTLHKNETDIIEEINKHTKKIFGNVLKTYKHGKNGIRAILYGKEIHASFKKWLGPVYGKKAKEKRVPPLVFEMDHSSQKEFLRAYLKGNGGVTKSSNLMSDVLYLFLAQEVIAGCNKRNKIREAFIDGRLVVQKGWRFDLKSPHPKKNYKNKYKNIPLSALDKEIVEKYCRNIKSSKHKRFHWERISYKNLIDRIFLVGNNPSIRGPELTKIFGKSAMEYFSKNPDIYVKIKRGRTNHLYLTNYGKKLYQKLKECKKISESDFGFCRIKNIKRVKSTSQYVYDVSIKKFENFVGGFGGVICHNTGAGLTASVVKDEFLGGWSLEAGTLVLANQGFAIIDELDKMGKEDRSSLHEALEQQTISIAKANIQATLRCETTVLAAANPKFGRFDPYDLIANQINLPPTLINRFDLIFPIKDIPNKEKDETVASFILNLHKDPNKGTAEISTDLMKKYFAYIRKKIEPKITEAAIEEIKEYYVSMRNSGTGDESGIKSIPITARQLEALVRLSEASAKIRLSKTVTKKDAQKAIELVDYCLNQIAKDNETGKIDIDRLSSKITATQRSSISIIKDIINSLEEKLNNKTIPIENVIEAAQEKNINQEKVEQTLEKLRRSGDIFEPKRGFIQRL